MTRFYGKYRGQVVNNLDPMLQGRLQVSCPAVLGDGQLSWAMPCVPYAGSGVGMVFTPPVGAYGGELPIVLQLDLPRRLGAGLVLLLPVAPRGAGQVGGSLGAGACWRRST